MPKLEWEVLSVFGRPKIVSASTSRPRAITGFGEVKAAKLAETIRL